MSTTPNNGERLDRYLDGLLSGAEREQFETETLYSSTNLIAETHRQRAVDASLRRLFPVPAVAPDLRAFGRRTPDTPPHPWAFSRRVAVAAILAMGFFGGWRIWRFAAPPQSRNGYAVQPWLPMDQAYREIVAGGFQPQWACKDDAEFAGITRKRLGTALALAPSQTVRALGWQYANTLGPSTMCLLTTVDAGAGRAPAKVIVFADRARLDRASPWNAATALHRFRRTVGSAVLYEVTPLDAPRILDLLQPPAP